MKINVLFSPVNADELYFANKTTVVIDVLRASPSIITALTNGAREVIPVATVDFAVKAPIYFLTKGSVITSAGTSFPRIKRFTLVPAVLNSELT